MTWLGRILGYGDKALDLADQATVDKDRLIQLAADGKQAELQAYVAELQARTFPLGDWIHKMGRQFTNYLLVAMAWRSMETGQVLDPTVWMVLGGSSAAYTVIKGRGK